MRAKLYLMKDKFLSVGNNPIKEIEIVETSQEGLRHRLIKEFEEILKIGNYNKHIHDKLELCIAYNNKIDHGRGIFVQPNGIWNVAGYGNLIPALKWENDKIISYV